MAESWALVTVPTFVIVDEPGSNRVGGGHLLVGYAMLRLIVALPRAVTGAWDCRGARAGIPDMTHRRGTAPPTVGHSS